MREPRNYEAPLCAQVSGDLWFPEKGGDLTLVRAAQRICAQCNHRLECAEWGIKHEEFGIWGGIVAYQREEIRKQRNIKLSKELSA